MKLLHTFSIVARDAQSGHLGVAVQTHWFAVGALCPWAEAGVGVVATQSMVQVSYGPLGLEQMRQGKSAQQALNDLLAKDEQAALRQVAMIDAAGNVAVHSGERCIAQAGHLQGEGYSVQANMMLNDTVWPAMAAAYEESQGDLAERMLAALKAAQASGGDIRGKQSACMLVVDNQKSEHPWEHVLVNVRVDDHPEPIKELERLLNIQKAYFYMDEGDALLSKDQTEEAMQQYAKAAALAPHLVELPFWQAVTLAESKRLDEALPIFKEVFEQDSNWVELLKRLPAAGLLKVDKRVLEQILAQKTSEK